MRPLALLMLGGGVAVGGVLLYRRAGLEGRKRLDLGRRTPQRDLPREPHRAPNSSVLRATRLQMRGARSDPSSTWLACGERRRVACSPGYKDPNAVKPGTKMPKFPFGPMMKRRMAPSGYLSKMKRASAQRRQILASDRHVGLEKGSRSVRRLRAALACHRDREIKGRFVGPDLTWVGIRKPESWEQIWLRDPPGLQA